MILAMILHGCLSYWGLAKAEQRSYSQDMTSSAITATRSYLKAKQWFEYRLEGNNSKILYENQEEGVIRGKGFLLCRVPYGVDQVDVEFHEFDYDFRLVNKTVSIQFSNIYSYSKDPNDITISYGPRSEREAKITIRKCFEPLAEDLFGYIQ
jgi:hypothetical protein